MNYEKQFAGGSFGFLNFEGVNVIIVKGTDVVLFERGSLELLMKKS